MNQLRDWEHSAAAFWEPIPEKHCFPRHLEEHLSIYYDASITLLSTLTVKRVHGWLTASGIPNQSPEHDRRLDGCIVAHHGHAFLLIDDALQPDERRMIVAHETAHFWIDYEWPRRRVASRFGQAGVELLDQERALSDADLLMATAAGVRIQTYYHYHAKSAQQESEVERRANTLACLLIAPPNNVISEAARRHIACDDDARWLTLLHQQFGMPERWGRGYLPLLARQPVSPSYSSWFLPSTRGASHDA
jgi:Zn-dependent peptidase ImmA (M78 family)